MEHTQINTCGCRVETDKHLNTLWRYCPKHEAASDMYEALADINAAKDPFNDLSIIHKMVNALRKAEGK